MGVHEQSVRGDVLRAATEDIEEILRITTARIQEVVHGAATQLTDLPSGGSAAGRGGIAGQDNHYRACIEIARLLCVNVPLARELGCEVSTWAAEAQTQDVSWSIIGASLGISAAAAYSRFVPAGGVLTDEACSSARGAVEGRTST